MTAKLTEALCAFHADVNTIHKDNKGNFGKYADLATVLSAVLPSLSKNGLAITQTFMPGSEPGDQLLVTTLHHTSGEKVESHLPLTISKGRNPLHDWGGATTYSRRFALLAMLSLAAGIEDDDGEAATPAPAKAPATKPQTPTPKQASAPAAAKPPADAPADPPLAHEDREEILGVLKGLRKSNPTAFEAFCIDFRKAFGLEPDALVAKAITNQKHGDWAQDFFNSLPVA